MIPIYFLSRPSLLTTLSHSVYLILICLAVLFWWWWWWWCFSVYIYISICLPICKPCTLYCLTKPPTFCSPILVFALRGPSSLSIPITPSSQELISLTQPPFSSAVDSQPPFTTMNHSHISPTNTPKKFLNSPTPQSNRPRTKSIANPLLATPPFPLPYPQNQIASGRQVIENTDRRSESIPNARRTKRKMETERPCEDEHDIENAFAERNQTRRSHQDI